MHVQRQTQRTRGTQDDRKGGGEDGREKFCVNFPSETQRRVCESVLVQPSPEERHGKKGEGRRRKSVLGSEEKGQRKCCVEGLKPRFPVSHTRTYTHEQTNTHFYTGIKQKQQREKRTHTYRFSAVECRNTHTF